MNVIFYFVLLIQFFMEGGKIYFSRYKGNVIQLCK